MKLSAQGEGPLSRVYNLAKLGQSGDEILLETSPEERAALSRSAGLLEVPKFTARITLKKLSPTRFDIHFDLAAEIVQACVVTLEPLVARIAKDFVRELHYIPNLRRVAEKEVVLDAGADDLPEEIDSLHYDLAAPLMEEFLLAIDPYPRAPGVAFDPPEGLDAKPQSPFAALKALKSEG